MTFFGQRDPRWANVKLGKTQRTLAQVGCTTCCVADGLSFFQNEIRPDVLARRLDYTADALILWGSLERETVVKLQTRFKLKDVGEEKMKAIIDDGLKSPNKVVLLNVDRGGHWVFALRYIGLGTYWVHDPWYNRKSLYRGVVGGAVLVRK